MSSYATPGGLIAVTVVLTAVGFLTTGLRFHVRHIQKAKLLLDDWLVIPAEVLLIGMDVAVFVGVAQHGLGRPVPTTENGVPIGPDVIPPAMVLDNKIGYSLLAICWLQLGLAKLSLLFFYRRIFITSAKKLDVMNFLTIGMIVITVIWSLALFFASVFECGTVWKANWDANDTQAIAACVNESWLTQGQFYSDFILDVVLFLMPLPRVWKLHMSVGRRVAVILILAVGALTVVASTIKVVIIAGVAHSLGNALTSPDPDILNSILVFWTIFESGLAIIVISLPTLRPYVDKSPDILRSLRSMVSLNSQGSQGSATPTVNNIRFSEEDRESTSKMEGLEEGMGNESNVVKKVPCHSPGPRSGIMVERQVSVESDERTNKPTFVDMMKERD